MNLLVMSFVCRCCCCSGLGMWDLSSLTSRPGMELMPPVPPAVEAQSPNHWTTREFPTGRFFDTHVFSVYYLPGTVLGTGHVVIRKKDTILALMECINRH